VDPKVVECLNAGHQALEKRDLPGAQTAFSSCVEKFPNSAFARFWLAMVHFFAHDAEKAMVQLKEVTRLDPDNPYGVAMLGKLYSFDQGKLALAKELLERALSMNPALEDARFDLARVYAQQGDVEKSFKEFAVLFAGEIRYAVYHVELAKILMAGGDKKEAQNQLLRALAIAPDYEPAKRMIESIGKEGESAPNSPTATPQGP
jgi:tetratricopeptide (TPR) repeat protein